ncbi:MAG: glutathione S-transferase C-terminal domain-containing protein [Halioglobus sp.]|nr:glutathione S-transferase C-terminal domain-containing protein [Halioglobus sp.]
MYPGDYTLIGHELSLFTRKLEAQLRFQDIAWHWQFKTQARAAELEARAGTHFIPLLRTPEKWLLNDTIAIGPLLHTRFGQAPVIPDTPVQRACCFILEDAFNHWLGKHAVHSRWCYPQNVAWIGPRFAANMLLDRSVDAPFSAAELAEYAAMGETLYQGFGKTVCEVNGVGPEQADAMQGDFARLLQALETHFAGNAFLLGPRPCLADFALAGACKAHFVTDPTPLAWLGRHTDMLLQYTARVYQTSSRECPPWPSHDSVPASLRAVFEYLNGSYFAFARANLAAVIAGDKYVAFDIGSGSTRARSQRRVNLARLHVQDELLRIQAEAHPGVATQFAGTDILSYYLGEPGR